MKKREYQVMCPRCGSKDTAEILYGMPAYSEIKDEIEAGKIVLGGCEIFTVPTERGDVQYQPERVCNKCGKKFGAPPLVFSKDRSFAEDYRDIVTGIGFSIGCGLSGYTTIRIRKNEKGARVRVDNDLSPSRSPYGDPKELNEEPQFQQITTKEWKSILDELYCGMHLHEWKRHYETPGVCDGTYWTPRITLTGKRVRVYTGSNAYPPYWDQLLKIFYRFSKEL